jgi:hypothetical protein
MFQHELQENAPWKRLVLKLAGLVCLLALYSTKPEVGPGDALAMIFAGGAIVLGGLFSFTVLSPWWRVFQKRTSQGKQAPTIGDLKQPA